MDPLPEPPAKRSFSFWRVLIAGAILGSIVAYVIKNQADRIIEGAQKESERSTLRWFELTTPAPRELNAKFTDSNGDLVADPPQDAAKRRSPEKLVFSFVGGPDAEKQLGDFKDFVAHLSKVTGKPVETAVYPSIDQQQAALTQGTLHVTGFNTGAVPAAVASCGFVPVCTFGTDEGGFGITMKIIVPAKSAIKKLEDVKGQTITFTTRNSNSGCKAALVLLQDHGLAPYRDYLWTFSADHDESIRGIAAGEYAVAPVASDLLQRAITQGTVKPDQFRVIYESERFPPATFGYAHDLSDDLAAKIREAFLQFTAKGSSLSKRFDDSQATKFVPVAYKQDFALVRRIDAAFRKPAAGE
jgi:phosphonate transport system substrate-binding protein